MLVERIETTCDLYRMSDGIESVYVTARASRPRNGGAVSIAFTETRTYEPARVSEGIARGDMRIIRERVEETARAAVAQLQAGKSVSTVEIPG